MNNTLESIYWHKINSLFMKVQTHVTQVFITCRSRGCWIFMICLTSVGLHSIFMPCSRKWKIPTSELMIWLYTPLVIHWQLNVFTAEINIRSCSQSRVKWTLYAQNMSTEDLLGIFLKDGETVLRKYSSHGFVISLQPHRSKRITWEPSFESLNRQS